LLKTDFNKKSCLEVYTEKQNDQTSFHKEWLQNFEKQKKEISSLFLISLPNRGINSNCLAKEFPGAKSEMSDALG